MMVHWDNLEETRNCKLNNLYCFIISSSCLCHLGFVSHLGTSLCFESILCQCPPSGGALTSLSAPSLCLLCLSSLSGCRHDGSERHDSSNVGGLQDTQVCESASTRNVTVKLNVGQITISNQDTDFWRKVWHTAEVHLKLMYKLEHVSADCSQPHTHTPSSCIHEWSLIRQTANTGKEVSALLLRFIGIFPDKQFAEISFLFLFLVREEVYIISSKK